MFLSEWCEFPWAPCLAVKETWWQLSSRCCWNRARLWHASELVSFLVGPRTYQHPGIYSIPLDDGLQTWSKHVAVDWRNKLWINSASIWFFYYTGVFFTFVCMYAVFCPTPPTLFVVQTVECRVVIDRHSMCALCLHGKRPSYTTSLATCLKRCGETKSTGWTLAVWRNGHTSNL